MNLNNFPFVDAIYRDELNPSYAGNPYIEALPALPDDKALAKALMHLPAFDPQERLMDASYRIQRLDTLRHVLVALPRVVRLARAMLKMLVTGYGPRRPYSAANNKTVQELYALQQSGKFTSVRETELAAQHSMSLIGASGCGKSFTLRHIAGMLPKAIYHEKLGKWQLPFIFLEMSYDGESVHTMASGLFKEYDRLLPDGRLTELYMERKGMNAEQRLAKALSIAHELGVGQIIVDEGQNQRTIGNDPVRRLRKSASVNAVKNETPLTKLLITASNTSHIPMVFSGTLEMQNTMGGRFTIARRMSGRGSAVWEPLDRYACDANGKQTTSEFEVLLRALFRYQWMRQPIEFSPEWADVFHEQTQGIPDIVVKLFESAQEAAIASGKETLTPELVAAVFKKEFVTTAFGIKALADMDETMLDAVPDLFKADSGVREAKAGTTEQFPAPNAVGARKVASAPPRPRVAKPQPPSPKPAPIDAMDLKNSDMRLDADGSPPEAARAVSPAELVEGLPV